jgi:hypothetical protein
MKLNVGTILHADIDLKRNNFSLIYRMSVYLSMLNAQTVNRISSDLKYKIITAFLS